MHEKVLSASTLDGAFKEEGGKKKTSNQGWLHGICLQECECTCAGFKGACVSQWSDSAWQREACSPLILFLCCCCCLCLLFLFVARTALHVLFSLTQCFSLTLLFLFLFCFRGYTRRIGRTFYVPRARLKQVVRVDLRQMLCLTLVRGCDWKGNVNPLSARSVFSSVACDAPGCEQRSTPHGYDEPESFFFRLAATASPLQRWLPGLQRIDVEPDWGALSFSFFPIRF